MIWDWEGHQMGMLAYLKDSAMEELCITLQTAVIDVESLCMAAWSIVIPLQKMHNVQQIFHAENCIQST